MIKANPVLLPIPFKYRDEETLLLFNTEKELAFLKKKLNSIPDRIYITYLLYNYNTGKYNITARKPENVNRLTLKQWIEESKKHFIEYLNKDYQRFYQLTGKRYEAVKIIGFSLVKK